MPKEKREKKVLKQKQKQKQSQQVVVHVHAVGKPKRRAYKKKTAQLPIHTFFTQDYTVYKPQHQHQPQNHPYSENKRNSEQNDIVSTPIEISPPSVVNPPNDLELDDIYQDQSDFVFDGNTFNQRGETSAE